MKHLFVPYDIALMAKEKGFNEPCLAMFDKYNKEGPLTQTCIEKGATGFNEQVTNENLAICVAAPLYQQLVDWFREKHRIDVSLNLSYKQTYVFQYSKLSNKPIELFRNDDYHKAYEGAIKEAFKLI